MTSYIRPELEKIELAISSFYNNKSHPHVLVTGPFNSGKTTLIKSLIKKYSESHKCTYINFREIVGLPELFILKYHESITGKKQSLEFLTHYYQKTENREKIEKILPFLIVDNKTKQEFFNVILYPEFDMEKTKKIIILDDFENITALSNFKGFDRIEIELLDSLMIQKNSLYIVTINSRSFDDVIFSDDFKKYSKNWCTIQLEPLSFSDSCIFLSKLLEDIKPNLQNDISLIGGGIPGYICHLLNDILTDESYNRINYDPENFPNLLSRIVKNRNGKLYNSLWNILIISLSRVRGSTSLVSCLKVLSSSDKLILKEISEKLSRSPQAVKDYLDWLIKAGLVEKEEKKYKIRDILMKFWILLNSTGQSEIEQESYLDIAGQRRIIDDITRKRECINLKSEEKIKYKEKLHISLPDKDEMIEFD
jgi:GTPase SAR1 family protein/DNA-binding MarR family transcriptional regulator